MSTYLGPHIEPYRAQITELKTENMELQQALASELASATIKADHYKEITRQIVALRITNAELELENQRLQREIDLI